MVLTLGRSEIVQLSASSSPVLPLTPERGPVPGDACCQFLQVLTRSPRCCVLRHTFTVTLTFTFLHEILVLYIGNIVCYTRVSSVLNPLSCQQRCYFPPSQTCWSICFWFYMAMKLSVVHLFSSNDIILDLWVKVWAPLYKLKMTRGAVCRLIPKQAGR